MNLKKDNTEIKAPAELRQAQKLAKITDAAVALPLIGKIGLDSVVGIIPVIGDGIMTLVSLHIINLARKMGVPSPLLKLMMRNAGIDFVLGFIPFVGDIIDIFYRANRANVRIMERWWLEQHQAEINRQTQQKLQHWQDEQEPDKD